MLKLVHIEGRDLPDAWYQCVQQVMEHGHIYKVAKGSYEGQKRWEFDFVTIRITHPGQRPLLPDLPPGITIPPPATEEQLEQYMPYLMSNERKPNETYTYGERLVGAKTPFYTEINAPPDVHRDQMRVVSAAVRAWQADPEGTTLALPDGFTITSKPVSMVNQVQTVIDTFKQTGEGWNQATMEVGRPEDCGTPDPPCLRMIDVRYRYGALHFVVYFRSWDLWNGWSINMASLQLLKEYMAAEIGCADGELIALSKGLHLYDHTWELAKLRTYQTNTLPETAQTPVAVAQAKSRWLPDQIGASKEAIRDLVSLHGMGAVDDLAKVVAAEIRAEAQRVHDK